MTKRVLVVEDDPDMAEVMLMTLESAGYITHAAANGKLALDAIAAQLPDLILLDMMMPVMDGWECAREVRGRFGRIPIVVVTAAEHARARAEEIDADDVLSKPFDVQALLEIVEKNLEQTARALTN
ncbi:MAG: response regulator [Polyangiaceae bacterium]|nr:response regulator [Polyangiaceae bacterium]